MGSTSSGSAWSGSFTTRASPSPRSLATSARRGPRYDLLSNPVLARDGLAGVLAAGGDLGAVSLGARPMDVSRPPGRMDGSPVPTARREAIGRLSIRAGVVRSLGGGRAYAQVRRERIPRGLPRILCSSATMPMWFSSRTDAPTTTVRGSPGRTPDERSPSPPRAWRRPAYEA